MGPDAEMTLETHHEALVREVRDGSGAIEMFERECGIKPNFRNYYKNYLGDGHVLRRTPRSAPPSP